ncbi:MAG: T9SS type A sorting domain-containing protein [Bacteroidota bacterium]
MKQFNFAFFFCSLFLALHTDLRAQWIQTSGPPREVVLAIAFSDPYVFAGTQGQIFRSTNNGSTWTAVNSGLPGSNVRSFAVIPAGGDAPNIFAGSSGVSLSTNNGENWISAGLADTGVFCMAVRNTDLIAGTNAGIYRSTNNGSHWTPINSGLTNLLVRALLVNGTDFFAGTEGGVFRSTNDGASWSLLESGITTAAARAFTVASDGGGGTNLLVGTAGGVFLSTDNGTSWSPKNSGLSFLSVLSLAAVPDGSGGTTLFAGLEGPGLFRSTNNGEDWEQTSLANTFVQALGVNQASLFAGTNVGAFLSTDNGSQWSHIGMPTTFVPALIVSGTNLFAGTHFDGVFRLPIGSAHWSSASAGPAAGSIHSLAVAPNMAGGMNLYAGTRGDGFFGNGVFRSSDNGASWTSPGVPFYAIKALAYREPYLFAGTTTHGVFRSTNEGTDWSEVNTGLTNNTIYAFAFVGVDMFVGTNGGIFRSTDNGGAWNAVNTGLPSNLFVPTLATINNTIFASVTDNSGGTNQVFRSTDNGASWIAADNGFSAGITKLSLTVNGSALFAGTTEGVHVTTDNGANWTSANDGLTGNPIHSLTVFGTELFAGTNNAGVWKRSLSEIVTSIDSDPDNGPLNFALDQNYPNPFNPSTTITFTLPARSLVSLKIFDLLGREVSIVILGELHSGRHSHEWHAGNLPNGVYFYRLQAEDFVKTRKLAVIR